ncbi:MAG: glycosyltransferase [Candidatus Latescibacterota bacterium]
MNNDIIFIGGMDWHGKYKYSTHHIVERLSARRRVFYIDNFGGRRDLRAGDAARAAQKAIHLLGRGSPRKNAFSQGAANPVIVQPILIPTPRFPGTVGRLNRFLLSRSFGKIIDRYQIRDPIVWTCLPTDVVWGSIPACQPGVLVYQSVDKFSEHPLIPAAVRPRFARFENMFTRSADLVFANARNLFEEKIKLNSRTYFFPNGVDPDQFDRHGAAVESLQALSKPVIGFAGLLGPWIDFDMLAQCAAERPGWSFVFIGAVVPGTAVEGLTKLANVHLTGAVDHADLGMHFKYFDAGIIPYRLSEFTRYTFPSKMAEYLAAGLPVISTALPEVKPYSHVVRIAHNPAEMIAAIEHALEQGDDSFHKKARIEVARSLSWDTIVGQMVKLIDETVQDKL